MITGRLPAISTLGELYLSPCILIFDNTNPIIITPTTVGYLD